MDGVVVMRRLLIDHAPLTALVPASNIFVGTVPLNTFPAVGIREVDRNEMRTVSMGQESVLVRARIQVTVYAKKYPMQKALIFAAKLGPGPHTGVIADVVVKSVMRESVGPDFVDDAAQVYEQSRDFMVTYIEPN